VPNIGPVVLGTEGDEYIETARILAFVWEGATSAGDIARVVCRGTGSLLWKGRCDGTQTYIGLNTGPSGIHAPFGFRAATLPAGSILVYLREV
jgi:hypothetical protein